MLKSTNQNSSHKRKQSPQIIENIDTKRVIWVDPNQTNICSFARSVDPRLYMDLHPGNTKFNDAFHENIYPNRDNEEDNVGIPSNGWYHHQSGQDMVNKWYNEWNNQSPFRHSLLTDKMLTEKLINACVLMYRDRRWDSHMFLHYVLSFIPDFVISCMFLEFMNDIPDGWRYKCQFLISSICNAYSSYQRTWIMQHLHIFIVVPSMLEGIVHCILAFFFTNSNA